MCTRFKLIAAGGLGAALMYLFDLDRETKRHVLLLVGSVIGALEIASMLAALKNSKTRAPGSANSETLVVEGQGPINLDTSFVQTFDYWSHPQKFFDITSHLHESVCWG